MTMDKNGFLSKEILDVFPLDKIPFEFKAISRASNLNDKEVRKRAPSMTNYEGGVGYKAGKIICKSNSLTSNVVIPNGDIQLNITNAAELDHKKLSKRGFYRKFLVNPNNITLVGQLP